MLCFDKVKNICCVYTEKNGVKFDFVKSFDKINRQYIY